MKTLKGSWPKKFLRNVNHGDYYNKTYILLSYNFLLISEKKIRYMFPCVILSILMFKYFKFLND